MASEFETGFLTAIPAWHAKYFFGSAEPGAYGYIDGFLCYCIVLSDVEMDGIHKDY